MAAVTTTKHALTRITEILVSGSGISPYTLPANTFSLDWWYEGQEPDRKLSTIVLEKPQLLVELAEIYDLKAWTRPSNQMLFYVEFSIKMAYFTDSKILKYIRDNLSTKVMDDVIKIAKALEHPGNLLKTDAGVDTGIIGGLLEQTNDPLDFIWDREASVLTGEITFTGQLLMSSLT